VKTLLYSDENQTHWRLTINGFQAKKRQIRLPQISAALFPVKKRPAPAPPAAASLRLWLNFLTLVDAPYDASSWSPFALQHRDIDCMWPFTSSSVQSDEDVQPTVAAITPAFEESVLEPRSTQTPETSAQHDSFRFTGYSNERLSMPPSIRWPILFGTSFTCGFGMGATVGGRQAADRYRAMNAHRQPSTQAGWYLYQRSKSYNTTVGAVKEGFRFGGVLSIWATIFMLAEEGLDQARGRLLANRSEDVALGQRDALNTAVAALMTTGVYTHWHRLDVFATTELAKKSLKYGLIFGLTQDALGVLKGEPPAYLKSIRRRLNKIMT
jgi:hypothetical protein